MSVIDRLGKVVRAQRSAPRTGPDVVSARRILELDERATLDQVRESYRRLARKYHPKTASKSADQRHAARTLLAALEDALEVLEAELLPLP